VKVAALILCLSWHAAPGAQDSGLLPAPAAPSVAVAVAVAPAPGGKTFPQDIQTLLDEELLQASLLNLTPTALALLASGANPNSATLEKTILPKGPKIPKHLRILTAKDTGVTPLMAACAHGNPHLARYLLETGATRHAKTKRWKTLPLQLAGQAQDIETLQVLLGAGPQAIETVLHILPASQRGRLFKNGELVLDFAVCTGKRGKETPEGNYVVSDKSRHHTSTIYHASMPYFMRLSGLDFGIHQGFMAPTPASNGCIRVDQKTAQFLFKEVPEGSAVVIGGRG
jgi:hypothetical protein